MKNAFFHIFILLAASVLNAQQPDTLPLPNRKLLKMQSDSAALPVIAPLDSGEVVRLTPAVEAADSQAVKPKSNFVKKFFTKNYPSPRKAALLSLVLPGAGQAYNRRWWKLPIVYGAFGGLIYVENFNLKQYRGLKNAHFNRVNDLPVEEKYKGLDATSLKFYRDAARKNLELTTIFLSLTYLLTTAEAFVDAHLQQFDVSDDLSLKIKPSLAPTPDSQPAFGIGIALNFK